MLAPAPFAIAGDPFWGIRRTTDPALLQGGRQAPLEPHIGVGPDRIVQTANFRIACYTRTGTLLWKSRLAPEDLTSWSPHKFWAGLSTEGAEDSKVVYDQFSGRFVVITMGVQTRELFIAISKDSSPANADSGANGAWDKFIVPVGVTGGPFTGIFHWPQLAVSEHWIWVTGWLTQGPNGSRHGVLALRRPPAPGQTPSVANGVFDSGRIFDTMADNDASYPVHHVDPLVMPTSDGGLALFGSRAIQSGFVDLVCVARRGADATGVLGAPLKLIQAGQAGVHPANRWGDYEGIALDPIDNNRVWITGTVGRCPTPSHADAECPTCLQPNPPPDCFFVECFSGAIGSYTIPDKPIRTLTVVRDPTNPPPAFTVKVMPMSIDGVADQLITGAAPYARRFGHGTTVTLMVGRDYNDFYTFSKWLVDGQEVSPRPGAHEKVLTLVMDQDRTVAPVFKD